MSFSTPPTPAPQARPQYWRGLEQLEGSGEFPASAWADRFSRRNFVKLMSASFLLAGLGLTGCRRPEERIYPFAKGQEDVPGMPQYYATAMPTRRGAVPLVVKSHEGRPTKIEGNPHHPASRGGTDVFAQASILSLYDPDRARRFAENGQTRTHSEALAFLASLRGKLGAGRGLACVLEQSNSPSRARLQRALTEQYPEARWFVYEPVDFDASRRAASLVYGQACAPYYKLDEAQVILSLDCDFLGSEEDAPNYTKQFAETRRLARGPEMSRLYAAESLFTLTGANADHRLRIAPSQMASIAARFAQEILKHGASDFGPGLSNLAAPARVHDSWIIPCAKDLLSRGSNSLVLAGHRMPIEAHILAASMNEVLGAANRTVQFYKTDETAEGSLSNLAKALDSGEVQTLVICGGNPTYNAPADLNWDSAKAKTVIRLGYYEDESAWDNSHHAATHWDFPCAHYLESWGDCRSFDGTLLANQPLIEPLFGGLTELELLARLGGFPKTSAHQIVRETFDAFKTGEEEWSRFLYNGFLEGTAPSAPKAVFDWPQAAKHFRVSEPAPAPTTQKLDVVFHRDYRMDDGRYNNNGWLQELPDPITKLTWDNAILLSPKTAQELAVASAEISDSQSVNSNVVEVTLNGRVLRGPVWVQPGMADNTLGLALGYGRRRAGRVGRNTGYNAYYLRTSTAPHYAAGAVVRRTGELYPLATTQSHWSMENRAVVREASLEHYRQEPGFAKAMDRPVPPNATLYPNPLEAAKTAALHQWGMAIDLNACTGCSACVVACQSENNIPIVGKEMVGKSREMHWLRIDRYYTGSIHAPQALAQPMLCQHCEAAPCENVCPVNATVHDEEGLNLMVYNRCVGTRYCSNNCPYKVRRFNFFDYNRRPLDRLYESPLTHATEGEWDLKRWFKNPDRGSRPEDEWQLSKLAKNPDVSVRMRGVMEKCSFCQQRIEQARIAQKVKAGASNAIRLSEREGTIPQTACQQACPADAIVFGDVSDPQSRVSQLKTGPRNYQVLEFLGIKPRVSYLAKVRNLNPEMPPEGEA